MKNKGTQGTNIKNYFQNNYVVFFFLILAVLAYFISGVKPTVFLQEIVSRFTRNSFLVLSLIIPVVAGLGLNFGIVIGAMAGEIAVIHTVSLGFSGFPSFLMSIVISTPIAILLGWLTGKVLNKTKGNEMITSMILGYLANGVYQFVYLFVIGKFLPFPDASMMNDNGIGIKSSLGFADNFKYSLSDLWKLSLGKAIVGATVFALAIALILLIRAGVKAKKTGEKIPGMYWVKVLAPTVIGGVASLLYLTNEQVKFTLNFVIVPMGMVGCILLLYGFNAWIFRTKLGHDFKTVGQNQQIAAVAGINVDRTRIIAIILSTTFAAWGMVIRLQDIGTMNTYSAHEQIGMLAIAAILVGGASVTKATNKQAILGVILFHAIFAVSPQVGTALFSDSQVGEYFRTFISYGIIFAALAMNAAQQLRSRNKPVATEPGKEKTLSKEERV